MLAAIDTRMRPENAAFLELITNRPIDRNLAQRRPVGCQIVRHLHTVIRAALRWLNASTMTRL